MNVTKDTNITLQMGASDFWVSLNPLLSLSVLDQFVMFPVGMLSIAPQLNIDENLAQDSSLLPFPSEVEPVVSGASIC